MPYQMIIYLTQLQCHSNYVYISETATTDKGQCEYIFSYHGVFSTVLTQYLVLASLSYVLGIGCFNMSGFGLNGRKEILLWLVGNRFCRLQGRIALS